MRYNKKELEDAVLGFELLGGGATWDAFNLEFENEEEFVEHFNFYWKDTVNSASVAVVSLYANSFKDYCVFHKKQGTVEQEGLIYKYQKEIFCIEG